MTPNQMALALPLATIATLLTVVACGPTNGDYVPVDVQSGNGKARVFSSCAHEMSQRKVVKVGALSKSNLVCAAKKDAATGELVVDSVTGKYTYELTPKPVKYEISREQDAIRLGIAVDFSVNGELTAKEKKDLGTILSMCTSKIATKLQG